MGHYYSYDNNTPTFYNPFQTYQPQCGHNYNGTINGVISSYDFNGVYGSPPPLFDYPSVYGYNYDHLNRLTQADGLVGDHVVNALPLGQENAAMEIGDENYVYDKIGNIRQLKRIIHHTDVSDPSVVRKTEGWNYTYNAQNRLTQLNGILDTPNSTYTYDENGNMLTDTKRMISQTTYSRGNFPYKLLADNKEITYLYSTDDQRMFKKTVSPTDSVRIERVVLRNVYFPTAIR